MPIWGRRDSEPAAEAQDTQEPAGEHQPEEAEHQAEEAAPAFWRAQGREPPAETGEPVLVEAQELAGDETQELAGDETQEPAVAVAQADADDSVISAQRWREILVAFVDDPRGSVKMASDAVDEAIDEFVSSVWARQRALASSWQGTEPGTEQLRTALLDYRTLWHQVRQLDLAGKTGGKPAPERARAG